MSEITEKGLNSLKHMLGMASNTRKSQWGSRNYLPAYKDDLPTMEALREQGLVVSFRVPSWLDCDAFYRATEKGCKAAGLHKAGIKRAMEWMK